MCFWPLPFFFQMWAFMITTNSIPMQGVICSGVGYYFQGLIMKEKGSVFVTAFSPLSMIIVAIMGPLVHPETIYIGR